MVEVTIGDGIIVDGTIGDGIMVDGTMVEGTDAFSKGFLYRVLTFAGIAFADVATDGRFPAVLAEP